MSEQRTSVVVFDVNETLSNLAPMAARFAEVGAPESLAATWFAATLRDGMALTLAGTARPFAEVARGVLDSLWPQQAGLDREPDAATDHVIDGFSSLDLHPEVAAGLAALTAAGHRVVTLSNGAASVGEALLERAGVRHRVASVLSVEDAPGGAWKPAGAAYRYALDACGVDTAEAVLVAVHPWDVHGAKQAGLRAAFVDRRGGTPWPGGFAPPDLVVAGVDDLAAAL